MLIAKDAYAIEPFDLSNVSIPIKSGEINDLIKGTIGKTIIHIQDAHSNYYAQ